MSYALIADFLQDRQSFKFFIRHRHQHIKPSAKEIAKVHILKADISILELHFLFRIRDFMLKNKLLKYKYVVELN
ncbi:hypothetical protein EA702_18730 [Acinetobacter baumannii]|nr:hypothetical protein [Acinetobacter baumannii]RDM49446.1 hypothetical protein B8U65_14585 [Acinetobacter baumannii]RSQ51256.1 hypothetical protein EA702_18730 [Acinetobacter baumannii]TPU14187.1 hypothetical protein FJU87_18550 [Acinetobacter baumannii]HAV5522804.1 hypothetical protein [Acinetobacter baumannii]